MSTTPIRLSFQDGCAVAFSFQDAPRFHFDVGTVVYGDVDDYAGEYTAVPSWEAQEFATEGKRMRENFTVDGMVELEVPNDAGGLTLTI